MGGGHGPGPIPPRWLNCPRKSASLIGDRFSISFHEKSAWPSIWFRFLAFKTPLDDKYNDQIAVENRFTPQMLFNSMKAYKVKIGLWIDLTNTSRFYSKAIVEENECKYVKLSCRGHGETPSPDTIKTFVNLCQNYVQKHPLDIIAVHCTHGFNR